MYREYQDMKMKIKGMLGGIALCFTVGASASPVAIDTMFVDKATANLTIDSSIGSVSYPASTSIAPPAEITMGSFQSSILAVSSTDYSLNIYSTGDFGASAPSGSVDAAASSIDVDFSSLRGNLIYDSNTYDFELWPLTTALDYGIYDPAGNTFDIGWSNSATIDLSSFFSATAILDVSLEGYLTTVPLPAAAWLFGTGFIALLGFSKRRKVC